MVHGLARLILWLTVCVSGSSVAQAAKDVVETTGGDRLVGEIKSIEKDVLTLEIDYSDAGFRIKWEKVPHPTLGPRNACREVGA